VVEDRRNYCRDTAIWTVSIDSLHPQLELGSELFLDCIRDSSQVANLKTNASGEFTYYWFVDGLPLPPEKTSGTKIFRNAARVLLRIVNDNNGCESTDSMLISDLRQIPALGIRPVGQLSCKNKTLVLDALVDSTSKLNFNWYSFAGNILAGDSSNTVLVDRKGWYYIRIKDGITGCENLDSVFVDEDTIKPNAFAGPDLLFQCKDTLLLLDASGSSTGAQYVYLWSTADGQMASGQGTRQLAIRGAGSYQLVVVDTINGCADTAQVLVRPDLNQPLVSIVQPDTLSCKKPVILLSANASSQSGNPLDILWTHDSGAPIPVPDTSQIQITSPGRYQVTATDPSNGCSASAWIDVQIDTLAPKVDAGQDQIWNCATQSIRLQGFFSGAQDRFQYQWSTTNGLLSGPTDSIEVEAKAPGRYRLSVLDSINGCRSADSVVILSDLTQPVVQLNIPDTIDCQTLFVDLDASGSSSGNRYQYQWTSPFGQITGQADQLKVQAAKPAWYYFMVEDTVNKCVQWDSIRVLEDRNIPIIQMDVPDLLTCNRKSAILNAQVTGVPGSRFEYFWSTKNGHFISGTQAPQSEADKAARYYFTLRNLDNGCEARDSVEIMENTNYPTGMFVQLQQPRCAGETGSAWITQIQGGEQPYSYFIDQVQLASNSISNLSPGVHQIRIVDANGCSVTQDLRVLDPLPVSVSLPASVQIDFGKDHILKPAFSIPLDSIAWVQWEPARWLSCSDCTDPTILQLDQDTRFVIRFADRNGCIASASIWVQIIKRGIWLPNAFSPNGDGINDWFFPVAVEDSYNSILTFAIFDRWGDQVFLREQFQANEPGLGWDGRYKNEHMNPGVFVYYLEVEWKNGERQMLFGDVSLLR
ncbi:MAG TPA: gliding motility-associated C-terminal domain-containing protein, partial [Saprospiraceae bacterium]|nr:gliding motility-associated C-terminal domain-containing protein [Saprospiraceae bacterium]